jgi:hypothetical protein
MKNRLQYPDSTIYRFDHDEWFPEAKRLYLHEQYLGSIFPDHSTGFAGARAVLTAERKLRERRTSLGVVVFRVECELWKQTFDLVRAKKWL